MRKRLRKAWRKLGAGAPRSAMRALVTPHHTETRIETARAEVAAYLRDIHDNRVAHGPFKGLQLPGRSSWGRHDLSAKILGTYEAQVVELLRDRAVPDGLLVDLGTADGYLALGALRAGWFGRCIAFERSEKGRGVLSDGIATNGVSDRVEIRGEATSEAVRDAIPVGTRGVLLCDIEGAEYAVLDAALLDQVRGMTVIVELHPFLVADGPGQDAALEARAAEAFDVARIRSATPPVWEFPELDHFGDDHRLLAFSEGRDVATEWLVLTPKAGS